MWGEHFVQDKAWLSLVWGCYRDGFGPSGDRDSSPSAALIAVEV
jgi:hypothetical protein